MKDTGPDVPLGTFTNDHVHCVHCGGVVQPLCVVCGQPATTTRKELKFRGRSGLAWSEAEAVCELHKEE